MASSTAPASGGEGLASLPADAISYEDLYAPLGARQLVGDRARLHRGRAPVARGLQRVRAAGGAVELLPVLLGRGRRRRQPLPVHRRCAARGAEVLPRHAAGRRGAPRGVLQAFHAGGLRDRRRLHGERAAGDQASAHAGLSQDLRPPRHHGRRAARRPLAREARGGGHPLPHRDRGLARAAGPALHLQLPRGTRPAARLPQGHGEHRGRRAAPHRLRREAARRPRADGSRRRAARGGRPAAGGQPVHLAGAHAARMGRALHHGVQRELRRRRRRGRRRR